MRELRDWTGKLMLCWLRGETGKSEWKVTLCALEFGSSSLSDPGCCCTFSGGL